MKAKELLNIIEKYSLTVRCLPYMVTSRFSYRKGDEESVKVPRIDSNGNVVERRVATIRGRKTIIQKRIVPYGGWWYVKETPHTDSTIRFSRKYDKFFASTLEQAIELFLKWKKQQEKESKCV